MKYRTTLLYILIFSVQALYAGDWPQYRHDSNRSAASPDSLPATLHVQWMRQLPTPRPTYPTEVRLRYDTTYEPVVLGKTIFVPSMVNDSVTAFDTDTGKKQWQFFTEGPVRFAPAAWNNKIYLISDDGYLYCVNAKTGELIWKFRGLPEGRQDRKLMGDGRLVSLYPARGGPAMINGIIYFGAGIWSGEGVFVHALDAESGRVLWSNTDSGHLEKARMDHGIAAFAGITPQGYFAVLGKTLVVPCGVQLPALLDIETGKLGPYTTGWGARITPRGSWFVAGTGRYLVVHSGDLYDIRKPNEEFFKQLERVKRDYDYKKMLYTGGMTRLRIDNRKINKKLNSFGKPIFSQGVMYTDEDGIAAHALSDAVIEGRPIPEKVLNHHNKIFLELVDKSRIVFKKLWNFKSDARIHIKAGNRLYCSKGSVVQALDIPNTDKEPKIIWKTEVKGMPCTMLAADKKLFVVTREGRIYAFGKKVEKNPTIYPLPDIGITSSDKWMKKAKTTLKVSGIRDGYVLMLGIDKGFLAHEVIRQSDCNVIGVVSDAARAGMLRKKFQDAGLYGSRISIHVGDPAAYPFPPFLANLILSENQDVLGDTSAKLFINRMFHHLRPYGGTLCLELDAEKRKAFIKEVSAGKMAGVSVQEKGDFTLISREGALPGADNWPHSGADAANTGSSQDTFLKGDLGRLWYDSTYRWSRTAMNASVRIADGRMLIRTDKLQAIDVYTGRLLWEVGLSNYGSSGDEAVVGDLVYVTGRGKCIVLDLATGKKKSDIALPVDIKGLWSHILIKGDHLFGAVGNVLLCVNRHDGNLAWRHQREREAGSLALGGGRVFCSDYYKRKEGMPAAPKDGVTEAFDIKTGKYLWKVDGASEVRYSEKHDLVVMANGICNAGNGAPVWNCEGGCKYIGPIIGDNFLSGKKIPEFTLRNLLTGKISGKDLKWARRGCSPLRASPNFITARYLGNAAYIDIATRKVKPLWNVRASCGNNIYPANGVLNVPNLSGGCLCNYIPISQAFVPVALFQ